MRTTTTITTMRSPFQLVQPSKYLGLYISTKHLYRKKRNEWLIPDNQPKDPFLNSSSQGASTSLRPHTTPRSAYLRSIQATNCSSCPPCTQSGIPLLKESRHLKMARHRPELIPMICSSTVPCPAPADNAAPPTKSAETNAETRETDQPGSTTRKGPCQGMLFRLPWFVRLPFLMVSTLLLILALSLSHYESLISWPCLFDRCTPALTLWTRQLFSQAWTLIKNSLSHHQDLMQVEPSSSTCTNIALTWQYVFYNEYYVITGSILQSDEWSDQENSITISDITKSILIFRSSTAGFWVGPSTQSISSVSA